MLSIASYLMGYFGHFSPLNAVLQHHFLFLRTYCYYTWYI